MKKIVTSLIAAATVAMMPLDSFILRRRRLKVAKLMSRRKIMFIKYMAKKILIHIVNSRVRARFRSVSVLTTTILAIRMLMTTMLFTSALLARGRVSLVRCNFPISDDNGQNV